MMTVDLTVPPNTTARAFLPEREEMSLTSGEWHFEYAVNLELEPLKYTMDTPFGEFMDSPPALEILKSAVPELVGHPMLGQLYDKPLAEAIQPMGDSVRPLWQSILDKLNA